MQQKQSFTRFGRLTNAFFRALPIVALMLAASQMAFGIRAALAVVTFTASKTAALVVDANINGQADPGDTLGYTVTVNNAGDTAATNAAFTDTIDANTTLVAGSLKTTPLARNDSGFSTVGNVLLTVPVAQSVLNNDNDPDGSGALSVTSTNVTSTNGGSVVMAANGSFTYNPKAGFTGTDTFTYTAKDTDNNTDTATVTITVGPQLVWFIDNSKVTNGDGRSSAPFNSIAGFNAVTTQAGQIIYVAQGTSAYSGTITLLNNQQLLGSGVALIVAPNLSLAAGPRPSIANVALASGNTVRGLNLAASSGTALSGASVGSLTINAVAVSNTSGPGVSLSSGALAVTLDSVSSSGGSNGIVLNSTTGSFTVAGSGAAGSGGAIQNTTGAGILLTSAQNISLTNMILQNIGRNGVDGSGVVNFTLQNSTLNNVGTAAAGQYDENGIAFEDKAAPFMDNTVSGAVTVTGTAFSNIRRHAVAVETWNGTISALTLSGNTFTSSTSAASSLGDAIHIFAQGSDTTTANLTTAAITNNAITNFPNGHGIVVVGGSGNITNTTPATLGASTASPITITGNTITGNAGKTFGNAIMVTFNGNNGVSHFNISNNGTIANPLTNFGGLGVSVFFGGSVTGTAKIDNNVIVANNTAGSAGIAVQVDDGPRALGTDAATVTAEVIGNNISANSGNDIRGIARASAGSLNLTVQNNTVTAPITANREGIRVDSGSAVGNTNVCLKITGNTSAGSGLATGIGLRKQGITANVNTFGVDGLSSNPTAAAAVVTFVNSQNPAGGGTQIVAGDNFVPCTVAPIVSVGGPAVAQQAPTQRLTLALPDFTALRVSAANVLANLASRLTEQAGRLVRAFTVQPVQASGETINLALGSLDPGQSITITFRAAINNPLAPDSTTQVCNQGTVSADGGISVKTDNPAVGGASDPTCTPVTDRVPPNTTINTQPAAFSTVTAPVFTFSGTDNLTPAGSLTFECALDADAFAACTSPITTPTLASGSHTFQVRAKDQVGNIDPTPASYTWNVDTIAPDTSIASHPTDPSGTSAGTFTFTGTDNISQPANLTFECQFDGGTFSACASPYTPAGQTNGSHTFAVRAKDQAGNTDATPVSFTWVVDTTLNLYYLPVIAR